MRYQELLIFTLRDKPSVSFNQGVAGSDRLYGSISNADIAEEVKASAGLEIDKRKIELEKPIHEVGSYDIPIRLTKDIIPRIKLSVIGEEKEEDKEEKQEGKAKKSKKAKKETAEEMKAEVQGEAVAEEAAAEVPEETVTEAQEEQG